MRRHVSEVGDRFLAGRRVFGCIAFAILCSRALGVEDKAVPQFRQNIQPLLAKYCYDCHGDGMNKGKVAFDELTSNDALLNPDLWLKVIKNVRAGLMPPQKNPRPTSGEVKRLEDWIKSSVFRIDPKNLDPGRVTVRRLNRVEYRNTIRDLIGFDYDTQIEFPPDDTGNGFDNNGDVLTLSPMLLEKYLNAAQTIVSKTVPVASKVLPEEIISGASFGADGSNGIGALSLSYYVPAAVSNTFQIKYAGRYQLVLSMSANEKYVDRIFDYNKCRFIVRLDGQELLIKDFNRETGKQLHYEFDEQWTTGEHTMSFDVQPLTPGVDHVRSLSLRINSVTLRGPYEEKYYVEPKDYRRFFPKEVPESLVARRDYARELLGNFASRAFRRPADEQMVNRLVNLAEGIYTQPRQTFEAGVAQAMVAVLASPTFLFREEEVESNSLGKVSFFVDEYSLASRLSYFLWSSMPDDELIRLAGNGTLRKNLNAQVRRMLADPRSEALVKNFSGQWLQTRDIASVPIDASAVLARDVVAGSNGADAEISATAGARSKRSDLPKIELNDVLRKDMRSETDLYFNYIVHQDRDVSELIESDYTFLNARLAQHYGLASLNVRGEELHKVMLPPDSTRGGVLTMGSILAVTSNPTRTSPVKRGLFILDNILGTPSPPPPANIPPLENSESVFTNHQPTLREVLSIHREQPLCASCHNRLDPPGLALENFNALGMWREKEHGEPIKAAGKLITGEAFDNVRELKHILATQYKTDFYRCMTEKLLTYALGRGLEYYDVQTVDQIVAQLKNNNGHFSALLTGVIESVPFQKSRGSAVVEADKSQKPVQRLANVN